MFAIVIPVYKNEENIDDLLTALGSLVPRMPVATEVVFVIDGSPDRSDEILSSRLSSASFSSRVIRLSRNFGSFTAIFGGLDRVEADYYGVLAADLQEPPELMIQFAESLIRDDADIVLGHRIRRADPWLSELFSGLFWQLFRKYVVKEMPAGGVDVFGCTRRVRDHVVSIREPNTNLIALLFWLGFRRKFIGYERRKRERGKSAWTIGKKIQYSLNSIFGFTDLPIQLLLRGGALGTILAGLAAVVVITARLTGYARVPGYTAIVVAISFFGGLTSLGLGIVGQYLWLTLQNARRRPLYLVDSTTRFDNESRDRTAASRQ